MAGKQYITRRVNYTDIDGNPAYIDMLEAQYATKGPFNFKEWDICSHCKQSYPKDELIYRNGKPYCYEHDCINKAPRKEADRS